VTSAGLARDRLTWLTYAQLGSYGYFLYGFGPTVSLLRDEQGVSRTVSGLHGTGLAVGALVSSSVLPAVIRRIGRGATMWCGLAGMCVAVVVYVSTDLLPVTLTGAFLGAFFGSFIVTPTAAVLSDHHREGGPSAISEANAVAAGIGTVAPLMVGLAVAVGVGWRAALLLVLPAALLIRLAGRGVEFPSAPPTPVVDGAVRSRLPGRYWIGWGVVTAGIAVEFCMTLWAADILRDRFDLGAAAASAGLFTVVGGMCLGRIVGSRLALRLEVAPVLYLAIAVCLTGFAAFWLTSSAAVAVPALFVVGLGISVLYPLGIARAIDLSEGRPDQATARAGLGAGIASGGGPFVLGALADRVGIHGAFLVVPVLLALAAVGVRIGTPRAERSPAR